MIDKANFYAHVRAKLFGGKLLPDQFKGIEAILKATECLPVSWRAYALATAYHEVDKTMQPIREHGLGRGRKYGVVGKHGQVAYGRGLVQLTWDYNYEKLDKALGLNGALTSNYDLALNPDIAARILREGMVGGLFTGKGFKNYLPQELGTLTHFANARRIINGTDKNILIAGYAIEFQKGLLA